jgi:hypothetical protein
VVQKEPIIILPIKLKVHQNKNIVKKINEKSKRGTIMFCFFCVFFCPFKLKKKKKKKLTQQQQYDKDYKVKQWLVLICFYLLKLKPSISKNKKNKNYERQIWSASASDT